MGDETHATGVVFMAGVVKTLGVRLIHYLHSPRAWAVFDYSALQQKRKRKLALPAVWTFISLDGRTCQPENWKYGRQTRGDRFATAPRRGGKMRVADTGPAGMPDKRGKATPAVPSAALAGR
jgi:hypothetical protein